jgi:hypothetical protein
MMEALRCASGWEADGVCGTGIIYSQKAGEQTPQINLGK